MRKKMAASQCKLVMLGLGLVLLASGVACNPPSCNRVSAAFYFKDKMHFIIGESLVILDDNNVIKSAEHVDVLGFPHTITAAVGTYDTFYLISNTVDEGYVDKDVPSGTTIIAYAGIGHVLKQQPGVDGIEAAVEDPWGSFTYFGGCKNVYVETNDPTAVSGLEDNSDLGLPCDLDAALYAPTAGQPVAIKGDKLWVYDPESGMFQGPLDMDVFLWGLEGMHLCPYTES